MSTATVVPTRRVFTIGTELRRQASRPRTRIALAFMVVLPLIVLGAFEFDRTGGNDTADNPAGAFANLINVATAGGPNFALFTLLVSSNFLLVVVFALFFGDTVASEATWGSLRYLLAVPVPRTRLLGVKLIVSLFYSVLALALLAGTMRYGWHPMRSNITDQLDAGPAVLRIAGAAAYIGLTLLVVAALAF